MNSSSYTIDEEYHDSPQDYRAISSDLLIESISYGVAGEILSLEFGKSRSDLGLGFSRER